MNQKQNFIMAMIVLASFAAPIIVAPIMTGCSTSAQRATYNTLSTIGSGVNASYAAYLDGVIAGRIKTNDVPKVSRQYNEFQQAFAAAVQLVQFNTNAPASQPVLDAAARFANTVADAQKGTR